MVNKLKNYFQSSINRRLTIAILLASTLFAAIMVGIQLVVAYYAEVEDVDQRIREFVETSKGGLSRSLWDVDVELLSEQMRGGLVVDPIVAIEVSGRDGTHLRFSRDERPYYKYVSKHELTFGGDPIGKLEIYVSDKPVWSWLRKQLVVIIITNGAKTFLMGFVILFLLHWMISRHLLGIAKYAEALSLDNLRSPPDLYLSPSNEQDELYVVSNALEKTRRRLRVDLAHRLRTERQLRHYQKHLKAMVRERTQKLAVRSRADELIARISSELLQSEQSYIQQVVYQNLKHMGLFLGVERLVIFKVDNGRLHPFADWTPDGRHLPMLKDKIGDEQYPWAFEQLTQRKTLVLTSKEDLPESAIKERDVFSSLGLKSIAIYPMLDGDNLIGFVNGANRNKVIDWSDETLSVFERFGGIITNTLIRQRNAAEMQQMHEELVSANERLTELAATDELTGLLNRRPFGAAFKRNLQQAMRYQKTLALLICDIDDFKAYNDTYGHVKGDQALKEVANVLQQSLKRSGDVLARIGGEEFAILLYDISQQHVEWLCNEICQAVQALDLEHRTSRAGNTVSMSIGATCFAPIQMIPMDEVMAKADQALYEAKEAGRNRSVIKTYFPDKAPPLQAEEKRN